MISPCLHRLAVVAALVMLLAGVTSGTGQAQTAPSPTPVPSDSALPPVPLPPVEGCTPDSPLPACHLPPPSPSSSPPPPCTGPGCLPQPTDPVPDSIGETNQPGQDTNSSKTSSCGITNISACVRGAVTSFIRALVAPALDKLIGLLSATVLTTPPFTALPRVQELWRSSWNILLGCYAMLVVIAGILVMGHESLQTRTSIKEVLPRVVVGFLAGALSLWIGAKAIELANALAHAISSDGLDQQATAETLTTLVLDTQNGGLFLLFLGLVLALMVGAVLLTYIVRVALTVILLVAAPLMLMCHALPHTEGIAQWWWKAFGGCLAVQIAQSLTLVSAMRVFLSPNSFSFFGPTPAGFVNILVAVGLMYILFKIPFWILGSIRGGSGRSFVGSLVKGFVAAKTFGLLRGAGAATGGSPSSRKRSPSTQETDPYAVARSTPDGQYTLPLPGLKRGRTPKSPQQRYAPKQPRQKTSTAHQGRQLSLPMDGEWPENKPQLGKDGQYQLPLNVQRQRTAASPAETPTPSASNSPTSRNQQLKLPSDGEWPENKPRLGTDGQYRLPIQAQRVRRPTPPPPPPNPRSGRSRQMKLPADGEWPEHKPRADHDGQYRMPLNVRRTRKPTPPPPPETPPEPPPSRKKPRGRQQSLPLNLPTKNSPRSRRKGDQQ